jgi:GntR family transcriptional regulator
VALRYERIADEIRRQIFSGDLPAGSRLAAESALAPQYQVSVPTIRQALDVLHTEGLIEKRHGRGNFVRMPQVKFEYANLRFWLGWDHGRGYGTDGAAALGDDIGVTADFHEVKACDVLASRMGVRPGTRLVECVYRSRRLPDGAPFVVTHSYLLRDVLGRVPKAFKAGGVPWGDEWRQQLAAAGVELNYVMERLSARPPSTKESQALGISRGVAVLALERTSFDTHGRVAEVADTAMSGDRVAAIYTTTVGRYRGTPTDIPGHGGGGTP